MCEAEVELGNVPTTACLTVRPFKLRSPRPTVSENINMHSSCGNMEIATTMSRGGRKLLTGSLLVVISCSGSVALRLVRSVSVRRRCVILNNGSTHEPLPSSAVVRTMKQRPTMSCFLLLSIKVRLPIVGHPLNDDISHQA